MGKLLEKTFCEWDGYPEYCIVRSLTVIGKNVKCSIRDYSHFSEENFLHDLLQIDWHTLISERKPNVDKLFSVLYTTLNKVVNKHALSKLFLNEK